MSAGAALSLLIALCTIAITVRILMLARREQSLLLEREMMLRHASDDEHLLLDRTFLTEDYELGIYDQQEFAQRARGLGMPETEIATILRS